MPRSFRRTLLASLFLPAFLVLASLASATTANAMKIQTVKSPGGIEAWLVEEHGVPLVAMHFAFTGGAAQDPADKPGVAHFLSSMLDEGAGDLRADKFQERMEEFILRMSFEADRDSIYGTFEMLTENREQATELLRLALVRPRFDDDAVERMRKQHQASLVQEARNPDRVADRAWYEIAFDGHVYGRPTRGTPESVARIGRADLAAFHKRVFARSNLKIAVVGDIDAATLGPMLDKVFGALPEQAQLGAVARVMPVTGGKLKIIDMDVPQSVAHFGLGSVMRKDKDFVPAFVLNHIIGGGGFASRLMEEVREKRGLAYSTYAYVHPYKQSSILIGGVATKNESINQSLDVIRSVLRHMAEQGPGEQELANAKSYLTGSYALRFDTSPKIAGQLLAIQIEDLGLDYINQRNKLIEAVTLEDIRRVARETLKVDDLIVTVVGRPKSADAAPAQGGAPSPVPAAAPAAKPKQGKAAPGKT